MSGASPATTRPVRRAASLGLGVSAALALAVACGGVSNEQDERRTSATDPEAEGAATAPDPITVFEAVHVTEYLRQLAPYLVSRELRVEELARIEAERFAAIAPILETWTKEPAFPRAARRMISQKLSVSGTRDEIDFDLPGNLAEYVVRENLPLKALLTADFCVDAKGAKRECDTGAPFTAGVLGTRAFMASRASRFNLTRASTMLKAFACQHYPMNPSLEPRIDRERLIQLFKVDEKPDGGADTFGNGTACYSCHGQFGPHAQFFVRFGEDGLYKPAATGLQDPQGELGRSTAGLYASHLANAAEAKEDKSQMFGKEVANLGEAAKVLADSAEFVPCQVQNLFEYAARIPSSVPTEPTVVKDIVAGAGADPTLGTLMVQTFSHPQVVSAVVTAVLGTP